MNWSAVRASGTRSSASASTISARPSLVDSANSRSMSSTPPSAVVIGADGLDQPRRGAIDARLLRAIQPRGLEQAGGHGAIIGCVGRAEGRKLGWGTRHGILSIGTSLPPVKPPFDR